MACCLDLLYVLKLKPFCIIYLASVIQTESCLSQPKKTSRLCIHKTNVLLVYLTSGKNTLYTPFAASSQPTIYLPFYSLSVTHTFKRNMSGTLLQLDCFQADLKHGVKSCLQSPKVNGSLQQGQEFTYGSVLK